MSDTTTIAPADTQIPVGGKHRLQEPGGRGGLLEVMRGRTIVQMIVRRDVRVRYRNSSIGYLWAFVKPSLQFCVYYFVIGIVLGISRRVENFGVYVFSGLCLLTFFNETLMNGSRSIIRNRAIIKKVWLPREIFPIAGMIVAATRFVPQFIILMIGATATGWYFTWEGLLAAVGGLAIVGVWGVGFGLLVAALNVYVREVGNVLELTGFLTHWLTPMIKPWTLVRDATARLGLLGSVILGIYLWNPLCTAVELFHLAFWMPTVDFDYELSPHLWTRAWIMFVIGSGFLVFAQRVFQRLQARFPGRALMGQAAVIVKDVSKSFQLKHGFTLRQALATRRANRNPATIVQALQDVSFRIEQGSGAALMGLNGSGKSTLLKLISGVMVPDSGTVHLRGEVAGLIDTGAGMHPELTCRENIYLNASILGMSRSDIALRFDAIVDFAGIPERFLETQVRFLSSGMFSRLGFSVAIHTEPNVFLVDEALAVGDSQFKKKCRRALLARRKTEGMTLIIVAHEVGLLRQLCSEALVLETGRLIYRGDLAGAELLLNDDDGDD